MNFFTPKFYSAVFVILLLAMSAQPLFAQDEAEYEVVLPEDAQNCVLPTAPDAIPEDADKDTLLAAKNDVAKFQGEVEAYRGCLSDAETDDITPGNQEAIVASYNYSVEMEERVAERFNEAIRSYNARTSGG